MPYYNFEKLNEIPLEDVCKQYNILLKNSGTNLIGKVRTDDKTPSFSISKSKNIWKDFGTGEGGSTAISLVQYLEGGINYQIASEKLANMFGIQPEKGISNKTIGLTNSQYIELGINPSKATMNMDNIINLEKIGVEKAEELYNKYGISMQELSKSNPKLHDMLVTYKALPKIKDLRSQFIEVNQRYKNETSSVDKGLYKVGLDKLLSDINRKVELLQRGLILNKKDLSYLKVYIGEKTINKEVGNVKYDDLKKTPGLNKYVLVNENEFDKLKNSNINFSGFTKDKGQINVVVKAKDLNTMLNIIGRGYVKQLGNINYSQLKKMGELDYMMLDKRSASYILKKLGNSIKVCSFQKENKINLAFLKDDKHKIEKLQREAKRIDMER